MRAVIQRVSEARVRVEGQIVGEIGVGFLVLLGGQCPPRSSDIADQQSDVRPVEFGRVLQTLRQDRPQPSHDRDDLVGSVGVGDSAGVRQRFDRAPALAGTFDRVDVQIIGGETSGDAEREDVDQQHKAHYSVHHCP